MTERRRLGDIGAQPSHLWSTAKSTAAIWGKESNFHEFNWACGVSQDTVVTEDTVQRPTIIYGVTKVFGELLGLNYSRRFGIDFRDLRFPQLIGPGVISEGVGQYNPKLIEAAIRGESF